VSEAKPHGDFECVVEDLTIADDNKNGSSLAEASHIQVNNVDESSGDSSNQKQTIVAAQQTREGVKPLKRCSLNGFKAFATFEFNPTQLRVKQEPVVFERNFFIRVKIGQKQKARAEPRVTLETFNLSAVLRQEVVQVLNTAVTTNNQI